MRTNLVSCKVFECVLNASRDKSLRDTNDAASSLTRRGKSDCVGQLHVHTYSNIRSRYPRDTVQFQDVFAEVYVVRTLIIVAVVEIHGVLYPLLTATYTIRKPSSVHSVRKEQHNYSVIKTAKV